VLTLLVWSSDQSGFAGARLLTPKATAEFLDSRRRYDSDAPGAVAEWLGRGLQSLVQRFESAPRLYMPRAQVGPVGAGRSMDLLGLAQGIHRLVDGQEDCRFDRAECTIATIASATAVIDRLSGVSQRL
jgi:hypothetical protein